MKRLVLFIMSVMAFAGMSVAQTVYTAGSYTNSSGKDAAIIFCNGDIIEDRSSSTVDYRCRDIAVDSQGDLYWVLNQDNGSLKWGDLYKNEEYYLDNVSGTEIYALAVDSEDNVYAVGTKKTDGEQDRAAIWRNGEVEPYAVFGDGTRRCIATGVVCFGTNVYTCGYEYWSESDGQHYNGFVWKNNDNAPFITLPEVRLEDIDYYDYVIYTVGDEKVDGYYAPKVFADDNEIYDASVEGFSQSAVAIKVDCGDVYYTVHGYNEDVTMYNRLWRNGEAYAPDNATYLKGLDVTTDGVYYTVTTGNFIDGYQSTVFFNDEALWTSPKLQWIDHLRAYDVHCDNQVRTLPYYENFEIGETDWRCWEVADNDDNNSGYSSYWHRTAVEPTPENYCAWHGYGSEEQEGWLVSPVIAIPEGGEVTLSFNSYEYYTNDYEYEGVWIMSESSLEPYELWTASPEWVSTYWKAVEIDLSDYRGQEVMIGFKYAGTNAHDWYIDDFAIEQELSGFTITTEVNPEGAGTVDGEGTYPQGAHVFLTANANPGWRFSHWQDGITANPREIEVEGDATYTANFIQASYTLTVIANPEEGGNVTGGGNDYHYGDMVLLTAEAAPGYVFNSWSDGSTDAHRTVEVTGDATYVANFSEQGAIMYTVTVSTSNPLLGSVEGGGEFPAGTTTEIRAIPNPSARFVKWDDGNTDNPRLITVTGDLSFTAEFVVLQSYTITVASADPTMGSATGGGTFLEGTEIQIKAIPNDGYYFSSWDDGNADNPRTITVTGNATYKAIFSSNPVTTYTLTVICNTAQGSVIGSGTYTAGTTVTIAAIPHSGYEFEKWNDENTDNPRLVTVNENMTFVAFFKGTGVGENESSRLVLYPNPASNYIRIEGIEANAEVRIYNAMGALVKVVNTNADEEIGISDLSAGLYFVRCGNITMRFLKE